MVLISRMDAYQQDWCGLLKKPDPSRESMGPRGWSEVPRGFEDYNKERDCTDAFAGNNDGQRFDMRGLPSFGFAKPCTNLGSQSSGDWFSQSGTPVPSYSSGTSHDCYSAGTSNVDSTEDASLSSYLMDGNVRAMLKKVTVNEGVLNNTIQTLGGGEKGLKELMGYIMHWVKEQNGEKCDKFSLPPNLEKLHPPQVNPAFGFASGMYNSTLTCNGMSNSTPSLASGLCGQRSDGMHRTFDTVQSSDDTLDLNQVFHRSKSRRLMGEGEVDSSYRADIHSGRSTFGDVRGSAPEAFHYPKLEISTRSPSHIGPTLLQGIHSELDLKQQAPCLQSSLSFASGHNDMSRSLAASTRAARKNRIARQRLGQSVLPSHTRTLSNGTAVAPGCRLWSVSPHAMDFRSTGMYHPGTQMPLGATGNGERKVCNMDMLTFLLQKELRPSDVGNLGRIILPKKEAEMHLPILALREGISLQMEDFDSGYCWNIRYRFWPNNKSRMYLLENTGEFVKSHHLEEGDLLVLYRNQQGNYVLRGKKKVHSESRVAQGAQQKNAHSLARSFPNALPKHEEVLKERDFGVGFVNRSCGSKPQVKAEPPVLQPPGDDDKYFKDVMHTIGSSFGTEGTLQPLERFPSLNLDFPLDEIMAGIANDDHGTFAIEPRLDSVVKSEPAG